MPAQSPHLLSAQPKVAGHHATVLEATGQVIDNVLVVEPVILIQVLLKRCVPCLGTKLGCRAVQGPTEPQPTLDHPWGPHLGRTQALPAPQLWQRATCASSCPSTGPHAASSVAGWGRSRHPSARWQVRLALASSQLPAPLGPLPMAPTLKSGSSQCSSCWLQALACSGPAHVSQFQSSGSGGQAGRAGSGWDLGLWTQPPPTPSGVSQGPHPQTLPLLQTGVSPPPRCHSTHLRRISAGQSWGRVSRATPLTAVLLHLTWLLGLEGTLCVQPLQPPTTLATIQD